MAEDEHTHQKGGVEAGQNRRREVRVDVSDLPPDVEVVIRRTGDKVQGTVGPVLAAFPSYEESRRVSGAPLQQPGRNEQTAHRTESGVESSESSKRTPRTESPKKKKKDEPVPNRDWETAGHMVRGARERWRRLDSVKYGGAIKAGLAASSIGLLPGLYYGSGLSTLGLGAAAVSLGALGMPAIGLYEGIKAKKPVQGLLVGSASGAGIAWLGGVSMGSISTAIGALALPAGLAYVGYKIGKTSGHPTIGMLAGGTAGLLAAPLTTGAITAATGGGWGVLGGAALGLGSTAAWAGGIGLAGAGLYGLGHLNKKLGVKYLSTDQGGVLGTVAQSLALPISAVIKGGFLGIEKWKKWRASRLGTPAEPLTAAIEPPHPTVPLPQEPPQSSDPDTEVKP